MATGHGMPFGRAFADAIAHLGNPRPSYRATTWVGQFRQLFSTRAGYEAMSLAGVRANETTLQRWLDAQQKPSKANQEAIARAYEAMQRGIFPRIRPMVMDITGVVQTGEDRRYRGGAGSAPLHIDLRFADWDRIEAWWNSGSHDYDALAVLVGEDLVSADIGDGTDAGWEFPSGMYTIEIYE